MSNHRLTVRVALFAMLATGGSSCSPKGKADGLVVDLLTGLPIEGALVRVEGTDVSTTTDKHGRFFLLDLKAGPCKFQASKGGYLALAETEATIAKGNVFHSPHLELVSLPPAAGLYRPGDPPQVVTTFPATSWKIDAEGKAGIDAVGFPQVPALSTPLNLIFYSGMAPIGAVDAFSVEPLVFVPADGATGAASFTNPGRWLVLPEPVEGVEVKVLGANVATISGDVPLGRFAMHYAPLGGQESWYLFDVEKKSTGAEVSALPAVGAGSADVATLPSSGGIKELSTNVEGIRAAEKDYMEAFGVYVPVKSPVPRPESSLTPNPVAWPSGTDFDTLGWAPDSKVAGTYWVEVSPDGKEFTVHGAAQGGGDKPVHWTATRSKAAAQTP
jgi:hypothetical protein